MILQTIYLPKRGGWLVKVFYAVSRYNVEEILDELASIDCPADILEQAEENMEKGEYNIGLTYSNGNKRKSVVVIGLTSSPEEFENTLSHERGHLVTHIAKSKGLDPYGEEIQYLNGQLSMEMFKVARYFLCEHCRKYRLKLAGYRDAIE